jgi:aromatic-L-amino-acid/L-tryptophan decarboxylase
MRRLGHEIIDRIVTHYEQLPGKPAMRRYTRAELESALWSALPAHPADLTNTLDVITHDVFGSMGHLNHPRFFGFIPTPGNFVSAMADALVAAYTPFCGTWIEGSGPAVIELNTIEWLCDLFGFPATAGGLFLSGGSLANLTALVVARESKPGTERASHVFYCSDQTHASVDRALRIIGYRGDQLRRITSAADFRIDLNALTDAIVADAASGRTPLAIIANAGTTNTGSVDPLPALAEIRDKHDLWLHADGAYGAAAILSARGRQELAGIDRVNSLTLDPHKWLFQPYDLGCTLVRDWNLLRKVFAYTTSAEYLQDAAIRGEEVNFCDLGPELTRPFRALKLWMSLKVFGAEAFSRAITRGIELAEFAEVELRRSQHWQVVSPAQLAIVAFRYIQPGGSDEDLDRLNRSISERAAADGCCFASTTVLRGRTVLRLCTIQPTTTEDDIRTAIACLEHQAS